MITELSQVSNNGDRIAKLINIEDEDLENETKSRVKEMLAQDAEYLLQKRRKEQEKRERVKRLEEEFQKKRSNKLQKMQQKNHKSELVRQKTKQSMVQKFKKNIQYHQNVLKKIAADHKHDLQKKMDERKEYLLNSRTTKLFSKSSHNNLTKSKTQLIYSNAEQQVEQKLKNINEKAIKAAIKQQEHQKQMIEKIRIKSKQASEAQKRALNISMNTQKQKLKLQYQKSEEMQKIYHRAKSMNQKKINQRRRTFKDKIDKCSQNLRHLSYLEEQKFNQIQNKYSKQYHPKQWKDPRLEKYWNLFSENARKLELQKEQKAEQILHKHQQITQQNKVYKQRKNKLIQAIKHT